MLLTLAAWLHNLDPFAINLGGWGIRWYGLSYAAGLLAGWLILRWMSRRGVTPLSQQQVTDAMVALVIGVVAGGRLGYVFFYQPSLVAQFTSSFPWWGVLRLQDGGMASHGGMIGVVLACWHISRGVKGPDGKRTGSVPFLHVMDLIALAGTPGLFFGRLANFVNGELLGKVVAVPGQPAPWWAVKFPQERMDWWGQTNHGHAPVLDPEQTRKLGELLDQFRLPDDNDADAYSRVLHALQGGPTPVSRDVAAKLGPLIAARHPSQLYQAFAEGVVLGVAMFLLWRRARKPGVIAAAFLMGYGALRVVTEFWRLPDSHLAVQRFAGLSRGQWLSVFMVLCGAVLFWWARRRSAPPMGGWAEVRPGDADAAA